MGKRVSKKSKQEFADELKGWRAKKKFSQSQAAEHLGLSSVRTLQNWEIARTKPQGAMVDLLRRLMK